MTVVAAVLAAAAAAICRRSSRQRLQRRPQRLRREQPEAWPVPAAADAALAVDLLAAALAAGATPAVALRATAGAATGAGAPLLAVAEAIEDGQPPEAAWSGLRADPRLGDAARTCARAGVSGAAVAVELRRIARRSRAARAVEARRRVQRASVWIVLPLGLCFLPAFVLVGIVPLVASVVPQVVG